MVKIDGKAFDPNKSDFVYQRVDLDTQILAFDDVKKNFDLEVKFSLVTEGITIDQIQGELDKEGVDVQATEMVDTENPTCMPTTGDQEKDGIISRIWDWANNPANRGSLKQTISSLKNAIFKAKEQAPEGEVKEQVGAAALITIGGVALTPSLLIAIGGILLFIIIVALISKGGKKKSACSRRRKLVRKFGMDGNFM